MVSNLFVVVAGGWSGKMEKGGGSFATKPKENKHTKARDNLGGPEPEGFKTLFVFFWLNIGTNVTIPSKYTSI